MQAAKRIRDKIKGGNACKSNRISIGKIQTIEFLTKNNQCSSNF